MFQLKHFVSLSKFPYGQDPAHYPIKAVVFILRNPKLWAKVFCMAFLGIFICLCCLAALLVFTLQPQAELIMGGNELQWWSWLIAVLLVLLETATVSFVILVVTHTRTQKEIFILTMQLKDKWKDDGTMKKPTILKEFNIFKRAMIVRMITYPIQLIPIAGAAIYSAINGTFVGWDYMDLYFEAIGMSGKQQRIEVFGDDKSDCRSIFSPSTYSASNQYCRFGFTCAMLEAIPIAGATVFPLTNACAAALFACDIESKGGPLSLPTDTGTDYNAIA